MNTKPGQNRPSQPIPENCKPGTELKFKVSELKKAWSTVRDYGTRAILTKSTSDNGVAALLPYSDYVELTRHSPRQDGHFTAPNGAPLGSSSSTTHAPLPTNCRSWYGEIVSESEEALSAQINVVLLDESTPAAIFVRVQDIGAESEKLLELLFRAISLGLQHSIPFEEFVRALARPRSHQRSRWSHGDILPVAELLEDILYWLINQIDSQSSSESATT